MTRVLKEVEVSMPKVSVVVPCYNVARFVRQCLASLKRQTLKELEFIVVNDGSTDGTLAIAKEVALGDGRFVFIDKPNSGYGDSVNQGIEKARGDYVGIIEPDDWTEPMMFQRLYDNAAKYDLDVSRGSFFIYEEGEDHPTKGDCLPFGKLCVPLEEQDVFRQPPAVWSAIYRREWLNQNKIRFQTTPGASFQDIGFAFKTNLMCRKFYATSERLLHYRMHENNSVKRPGAVYAPMAEYQSCRTFAEEKNRWEAVKAVFPLLEYATYKWNYLRVSPEDAPSFFQKWREEWQSLRADGVNFWQKSKKIGLYAWLIRVAPVFFERRYLQKKRGRKNRGFQE